MEEAEGVGAIGVDDRVQVYLADALEMADEIGAIGMILAVIGAIVLGARATSLVAWLALTAFTALLFAHATRPPIEPARAAASIALVGPARSALPAAICACCVFASAGVVHVSGRLGRARIAAASALAVILVLSPAMDRRARRGSAGSPMHLLDRALERAEARSMVFPGSPTMDGLFALARAMGLRPDLEVRASNRSFR